MLKTWKNGLTISWNIAREIGLLIVMLEKNPFVFIANVYNTENDFTKYDSTAIWYSHTQTQVDARVSKFYETFISKQISLSWKVVIILSPTLSLSLLRNNHKSSLGAKRLTRKGILQRKVWLLCDREPCPLTDYSCLPGSRFFSPNSRVLKFPSRSF